MPRGAVATPTRARVATWNHKPCRGAFARSTLLDRLLDGARDVPHDERGAQVDHYPAAGWISGRAPLKLGFFLGGFGGRGHLYSNDPIVDRAGGSAGLSYWFAPTFRLGPTYGLTYNKVHFANGSSYDELNHSLTIAGVLRLP